MLFNPYIAGNPIRGETGFFGREDILREVMQLLNHPKSNAMVLFGQRRIGKTTILLQLEERLQQTNFTPVYFDLQDKASKPLVTLLYELAQRIAHAVGQPSPDHNLFDVKGDHFRHTFLPNATQQAKTNGLVLLFDEFDVLDTPDKEEAGDSFFPYLRSWISDINKVQFLFVIGRRPEDLSIDTLSTFKATRASRVSLLDETAFTDLVRAPDSINWADGAIAELWRWTQGHPYFTQLLCSVIWENAYEDEPDSPPPNPSQSDKTRPTASLKRGGQRLLLDLGWLTPRRKSGHVRHGRSRKNPHFP